jgi:hypothetical protein
MNITKKDYILSYWQIGILTIMVISNVAMLNFPENLFLFYAFLTSSFALGIVTAQFGRAMLQGKRVKHIFYPNMSNSKLYALMNVFSGLLLAIGSLLIPLLIK